MTAHSPFQYERIAGLVAAILQKAPHPIDELRPDVPRGLQAVVGRCLEKDPAQRFATVAHLATALAPFGPPGSARSVERVAHVLRRAEPSVEAADTQPMPFVPVEARPEAAGAVESVAGSSRSVREPPPDPTLPSRAAGVPRRGRIRASVVAGVLVGVAGVGGFVAISAPSGEAQRSLIAPSVPVAPSALALPSGRVAPEAAEGSSLAPLAPPQALDSAGQAQGAVPPPSRPAHAAPVESANRKPRAIPTGAIPALSAPLPPPSALPPGPGTAPPDDPLRRLKTM